MKRRDFLKGAVAGLGLAALRGLPAFADGDMPNIILAMADDQGWGDMAYNGHKTIKTPNFDAMARDGLRFDRFYAAAPVCSPTRGSCLTGRHPNRFGCFRWGHTLRPQEITVAEALKKVGYATGHFGKWHLGSVLKESPVCPGASGFGAWTSAFNFFDMDPILSKEGQAFQAKGESSAITVDAAIEFIRAQTKAKKPFLAVVWFGSPHNPYDALKEDLAHYEGNGAKYLAEITAMDREMGRLRKELATLGIRDNTILWYTSDNGGVAKVSETGGRGSKAQIYEGGLRVPALLEWPARIKQSRVTDVPCNTSDFYPTLLEITGAKVDKQPPLDGVSLVTLIDGKMNARPKPMGFWDFGVDGISTPSDAWMKKVLVGQKNGDASPREMLFANAGEIKKQYPEDRFPGHAAWLDGTWKLHAIGPGGGGKKKSNKKKNAAGEEPKAHAAGGPQRFELYDLAADPMEKKNLAGEAAHAARVKAMTGQLHAWQTSVLKSLNGKDY